MKYLSLFIFTLFFSAQLKAQNDIDTATIRVEGVCGMCKERIENAAYIKGVKKATWEKETKILTLIYKPDKVTLQKIEESIAAAGHDTEHLKATEKAYLEVHKCCRYRELETH
jgi:copper chaperone CopZ